MDCGIETHTVTMISMFHPAQQSSKQFPRAKTLVLIGLFITLLLQTVLAAQIGTTLTGLVVSVADGDTVSVRRDRTTLRVRVEGIDTPELNQAFGHQAKTFTSLLLLNKHITVNVRDRDRYGRLVGRIYVDGRDLSVALVLQGLAWHYTRYSSDPTLAEAERQARAAQAGLWSQSAPVPPWDFRSGALPPQEDVSVKGPLHGNRRSRVFHQPNCRNYTCQNCTVVFRTTEDALEAGFRPAGDCHRRR